ncbi:MAG TPA: hypothetical protein VF794_23570 [Archangium sp.]|jgi:hypothetical protein|uniref:hypothetical protein n=1 Tax=Archangium sp. TaxID=1872627 RepID=UPI002ED7977C
MRGMITLWDVLANLGLVRREFGAGCVVRCVLATLLRRRTTFLEIALRLKDS